MGNGQPRQSHIENSESSNDSRSANNNLLATEAVEVYFSVY